MRRHLQESCPGINKANTRLKALDCRYCTRVFSRMDNRKRHEELHHLGTSRRAKGQPLRRRLVKTCELQARQKAQAAKIEASAAATAKAAV